MDSEEISEFQLQVIDFQPQMYKQLNDTNLDMESQCGRPWANPGKALRVLCPRKRKRVDR